MRVREFAVPLQALFFILMCFGLVWMLYAMAFYDPSPPTLDEVNSEVTFDPQMNDMRTSAAQTVNALFGFGPTAIFLSTPTMSLTPTVTPTVISVANTITPRPATDTATPGIEPTWTDDRSRDGPTNTPVPPTQNRPTATFTLRPSRTPTKEPPTKVPPTSVPPTSVPPTSVPPTSVPPTSVPPTSVPPTEEPTEPPATSVPVVPQDTQTSP